MMTLRSLTWSALLLTGLGLAAPSTPPSVFAGGDGDVERSTPVRDEGDSVLVVSAKENALVLQDPISGERKAFFRVGSRPNAVAVSADGRTAVVTNRGGRISGNTICVVDLNATNLVRTILLDVHRTRADQSIETRSYHRPSGVTFLPRGRRVLVTCAIEGALLLVDLDDAVVIGAVGLEAHGSHDVLVDHEGRFAYVANRDSGTVSVVELGRMRLERNIEAGGGPRGMGLHPLKDEIWVTNTDTNSISIIDLEERDERIEFACGAMPVDVCFTPGGEFALVTNMQEGNVSVFDTETLRIERVIELERVSRETAEKRPVEASGRFGRSPLPTQVIVEPSGERAWISTRRDDRLHRVDLKKWRVTESVAAPIAPDDLGWSSVDRAPLPVADAGR